MDGKQLRKIAKLAAAQMREVHEDGAAVGQTLARAAFEVRGNHTEAHLSEGELAALLTLAAEWAASMRLRPRVEREPAGTAGGE